jgi:hypothetical protein
MPRRSGSTWAPSAASRTPRSPNIQGTSNGSPVAHTLRFTWSASCSSSNGFLTGGDECAVRLGLPVTYSGQTAGEYPGIGGRTQANDGHFVTISLVSLCGDGVVQGSRGEQCDLGGGLNGTSGTCCSSSCQLLPNGATCRASAGVCDLTETCDGVSDTCPADAKSTVEDSRPHRRRQAQLQGLLHQRAHHPGHRPGHQRAPHPGGREHRRDADRRHDPGWGLQPGDPHRLEGERKRNVVEVSQLHQPGERRLQGPAQGLRLDAGEVQVRGERERTGTMR